MDFTESATLLVHLDIEYLCKNATRTLLNMKLDIGLEELERIYQEPKKDADNNR